ncbi:hypothetical protein [Halothiobacillus sp.]|uniref:hypothetical protein n=1 Tax=Halothiobacillus sp. TaxID=1891311 RepID=UPI00199230F4|nr:hypothetical protein [Halothiobacillus sp.]MBC7074609.1 hypothetical protein [Syntrophomonadaceae bacterium]
MSAMTKKIDAEIEAWAKWARTQYPFGYGNSPCDKWDKPSFGTAFIDQSSETIFVPFEHRHMDRVINHVISKKHAAVIKALYIRWFDKDTPPAIKRMIMARDAGCSVGALAKVKEKTIRAVAIALCADEKENNQ